ncbi:uncharacterized protein LOC143359874 isoform X2 [Halictus rubicundus]|uniref:uncharacterized protein LOC143359874 isoform X2 n=1 Tax=Halictus rubicundus TaxID=77578 RepID=UPI004036A433
MAHSVSEVLGEGNSVKMVHQKQPQSQQQSSVHQQQQQQQPTSNSNTATRKSVGVMGSRRIFAPAFKLKVLDSYRNDIDCRGNQRATARKYGIHRRQIQKWLQCEDNLRNSCAESGNTVVSTTAVTAATTTSTTVISSTGVPKPDGTVTEATGPAVAPAAPALNLSLARLHGDELAAQQGPPPLLPHPPHGGAPSSPQYVAQSTTASAMPVRYQEYTINQEQRHLRREAEDRMQEPQSRYYVANTNGHREIESSSYEGRGEVKVYQNLSSYRVTQRPEHRRYTETEMIHQHQHRSAPSHNRQPQQSYGDVDSSADGKSSYGLLLAPSMIKTERASPDSAATPGPCESTCSPGAPRGPLSPVSHSANSNSSTSSNTSSTMSVHFDSPRAPASPCLYPHHHALASPSLDSEKPIRESKETHIGEKGLPEDTLEVIGGAVVKEELQIEEETSEDGREAAVSSYVDYQRPPVDSRPVSPMHDREGYSLPSSPRGPASSGRSSSSCSDSEMDPLDCSSGSQNSSNDLTRRRSFSLRFKLDVLDAFHRDVGVAGNQRATARKFGINRRQVQKWLGQETELRGEIAVRGNSRQRLGPVQDVASGESPVDLRTSSYVSSLSQDRIEAEYERSPPPPLYCCDVGSSSSTSSSQHLPYYQHPMVDPSFSEGEPVASCNLSCCLDSSHAATPITSCYQETSIRGSCYSDPQNRQYCYSPGEYSSEIGIVPESTEEMLSSSPLKRHHCTMSCCYEALHSPKRLCVEQDESVRTNSACQETPPQETPLCLVKPKRFAVDSPSRTEPVTSTVPTPPASAAPPPPGPTSKKDAILFKPYLDNPVSKPAKEPAAQRGLSPVSSQIVNNNNCQSICNLNEASGHDYALELSLRLPISWRTHQSPYTEFPQVSSAFVRYPASPHYT